MGTNGGGAGAGTGSGGYTTDGADGPGWDPGEEDDSGPMVKALGRQLKMWRESAGLRQAEFGAQIGYGADMVAAVEGGRRIPKPEYLEAADRVLGAGGRIEAMQRDLEEARYPKKVRDLKKLEAEAVELCVYSNHTIHALLQTEEYTRALFGMRRPLHPEEVIERNVAGRMARQEILDRSKHVPVFSFVQEEVTLSRPLGGRMVKRQQLERLLEVGQFRNVEIQVMPTDREDHAGLAGGFRLFKLHGGKTFGYSEGQHITRLITEHREVQSLEMQYGIIRAQALTPQESLAFIEKLLGET